MIDAASQRHWPLPDTATARATLDALSGSFDLRALPASKRRYTFYDSFPWQLWFADKVLYRVGNDLVLREIGKSGFGDELARAEIQTPTPCFWWDFPEGPRSLLRPLIKLRALLPCVEFFRLDTVYEIKNADDKTVARVSLIEFKRPGRGASTFSCGLSCQALRGYDAEFDKVNAALTAQGLLPGGVNPLRAWFELSDDWPQSFSSKAKLPLSPDMRARDVVCEYLSNSLALARRCEQGIIDDIDSEFLHDFRVCFRSMRSVLAQIKGALTPEQNAGLKRELAEFGKRTNRLRDLDVYLLDEARYKSMVPDYLAGDLGAMFQAFRRERRKELDKLRRFLKSKTYANRVERIGTLLEAARGEELEAWGEGGVEAIIDVARRQLDSQFRKVRRKGRKLHHDTEDEAVHALRIQCKKLRYSIELFAPLCEPNSVSALVGVMKNLQNTLGEFNDLCVQQEALRVFCAEAKDGDPMLYAAIGALLANMYRTQVKIRGRVVKLFDHFNTAETRKLFKHLLPARSGKRGEPK